MMLRVEPQCYHVMSRCSGVCMSIDTQIFISCDLPVSPPAIRNSSCASAALYDHLARQWRVPQAQQTLVWTPWCVPSMDMSYSLALAVLQVD